MTKRKKVKERMEITEERSLLGNTCKEEKTMKSHGGEEELNTEIQKGGQMMHVKRDDSSSKPSSPDGKDLKEEDQLQTAKARVGKVREENERLKLLLAQMVREYQSLQMHFFEILQQEEAKKSTDRSPTREETEESELVSLSLGRISSEPKKDETNGNLINGKQDKIFNEGLAVGLDCRFVSNSTETENKPSSESSFEELMKEEEPTEMWPPSKILKTVRSGDEEDLKQTNLKKARVSVRARCDTPTMNDGCQWRKYGQKIAKGNPCPRAYYRCTVSPACPVRKQVQRWMEDMSILVTTYEGTHDHPLPFSAKAMASTTSAAASMLQCRSSTSVSTLNSTSTVANLHGSNFSFSQNATPFQLYFPNSSIFTNNSHPTVVLDLTAPSAFSHFNRLSSAPRYSSMCLNFANPSSTNFIEPDTRQTSWSSAYSNYGTPLYNKDPVRSLGLERQPPQEHIYQPYSLINNHLTPPHQSLKETTIATTTEDITSNPNFQSALAAAITSYIGNEGRKAHQNQSGGDNSGLNLSWNESFPVTTAKNGIGCTSSMFLNKLLTSTSQQEGKGSMSTFPPPLPFSKSKSASGSPADHTENHFK